MLVRDRTHHRQAQAGAATGGAGREERLEQAGLRLAVDARSVVLDDQADPIVEVVDADVDRAAGGRDVQGISYEVQRHLLELISVAGDPARAITDIEGERDTAPA